MGARHGRLSSTSLSAASRRVANASLPPASDSDTGRCFLAVYRAMPHADATEGNLVDLLLEPLHPLVRGSLAVHVRVMALIDMLLALRTRLVVFDEVHRLGATPARRRRVLNLIRGLQEDAGATIVLLGNNIVPAFRTGRLDGGP